MPATILRYGARPVDKDSRIYVAGHDGLVGSALVRRLKVQGYERIITRPLKELDLTDQAAARDFFTAERPDHVFLAAAKVGGIHANNTYPAEFIQENLAIQTNVIHEAWRAGVGCILFLGSSCICPRECPQPIKESYLLTGKLEPTNKPYAIAKIAGIEMCWSYNRQYGAHYRAVMPTNLYGPGDNFHLENSHVVPALIRKFHKAKITRSEGVEVWGTGKPLREFLYVDDMAEGCIYVMNLEEEVYQAHTETDSPLVNLGVGKDISIRGLAELVKEVVGYEGNIVFDTSKPDGTPRKLLDVSRLTEMGWTAATPLKEGLAATYAWFLENLDKHRT